MIFLMKPRRIVFFLLCIFTIFTFTACTIGDKNNNSDHEPLSIVSMFPNIDLFIKKVNEKYPEIRFKIIPYLGSNMTAYLNAQLESGDMPDIYITTNYAPGVKDLNGKLLDLSGYNFTSNFSSALLHEVSDNGAIYLLPTYYSCIGITYNKTLLEKTGWTLPKSFDELRALAPKVKAAGCKLALNQIALPGYGFQYICNILDTGYLNTLAGRKWQNEFLNGDTTVSNTNEMLEAFKVIEEWKEIGMLNGDGDWKSDNGTKHMVAKGNTLFMLGGTNNFTSSDSSDVFSIMPYLSKDGTKNSLILQVARYIGLNSNLEKNEEKLTDALHVMEVLSTIEGMSLLNVNYSNSMLLPLKDYIIPDTSYYKDIEEDLNKGLTSPFIYNGWENVIVPIGNVALDYIRGIATLDDVIKAFDESKHLVHDNSSSYYTVASEKIENEDCIRLVGECFAKASGADFALISKNEFHVVNDVVYMNNFGVSGELYALPITDQEITSILPTGWRGNIKTVTFTGSRIKEIAETGFNRANLGVYFPYEIIGPKGLVIEDDKVYSVVITGVTDEIANEGKIIDTDILGLTAAQEYFKQFKTFSKNDIKWEKIECLHRLQTQE